MKKLDLVKLINEKPYVKNNLIKDMHGIVINKNLDNVEVLFFNPQNVGDYAIVNVNMKDLILEKETLPQNVADEISSKLDTLTEKAINKIEPIKIKQYDIVELLVEDGKYTKFGIHKGDRGCVMDNNAVQNYIEVDFSGINENGEYYGDCISVKINDLKIIK